ncbi:MAG: hypothetical protein QNJ60_12870, partial [Xenococcaceae cyanobacterium MO_188.B19]|nr:hypothetical protein [Xenococcaceae cyanobacterium MO_188.B19]
RLSWHELRSPNTKPYERWLLKFLVNSTVVDVANKLDTPTFSSPMHEVQKKYRLRSISLLKVANAPE